MDPPSEGDEHRTVKTGGGVEDLEGLRLEQLDDDETERQQPVLRGLPCGRLEHGVWHDVQLGDDRVWQGGRIPQRALAELGDECTRSDGGERTLSV